MTTQNLTTCRCNHCSGEIEFESSRDGETITCPICAMETILYVPHGARYSAPAPPPPPPRNQPAPDPTATHARRIKKRERFGIWSILELLGYLIFLPFLLLFIGSLATFSSDAVWLPVSTGIAMIFGAAMVSTAHRFSTRWLCSNCKNKLTDKEARMCAVCHAHLS